VSDFPHSKHNRLDRGVIKPQNGHIRCDPYSRAGRSGFASFTNEPAMTASQPPKRLPTRRMAIDPPSRFLSATELFRHWLFSHRMSGWAALAEIFFSISAKAAGTSQPWQAEPDEAVQDCSHSEKTLQLHVADSSRFALTMWPKW